MGRQKFWTQRTKIIGYNSKQSSNTGRMAQPLRVLYMLFCSF